MFSRVFSGHVGIDPYTTAVSDVYQDLFHEGSYVGKGIYDVDAFEAALDGRVPENALLSHDLFEGFFARAALCTDIHLIDDYPSNYLTFSARQHRWVRGDWQIARWLWRTVPGQDARPVANRLPAISRWKILDNLRRSLMAPALMVLLCRRLDGAARLAVSCGWPSGCSILAFPAYMQLGRSMVSRVSGVPLRQHLHVERENILMALRQAAFSVLLLAHQTFVMADAIGRVLFRLLLTRRHLLQWVTADRVVAPRTLPWRPGADVAGARPGGRRRRHGRGCRARSHPAGGPDRLRLAAVAGRGLHVQRAAQAPACAARHRRSRGAPPRRPEDLALLRGPARSRRQLADSGQLPGQPRRRDRAPDLTHQHRPAAAGDAGGLRHGVSERDGRARPPGADLRDPAAHAALPGPLLQLVRHEDVGAAGAGLHLDRGQRQPRRLSPDTPLGSRRHRGSAADHRSVGARRDRGRRRPLRGGDADGGPRRRGRAPARAGRRAERGARPASGDPAGVAHAPGPGPGPAVGHLRPAA